MRYTSKTSSRGCGVLLAMIATAASFMLWSVAATAVEKPDYSVGDRLTPATVPPVPAQAESFRRLSWDDLMPRGWDPMKAFDLKALRGLSDGDPRARDALDSLRKAWDNAPVRSELNNERVRLPGCRSPGCRRQGGP